MQIIITSTDADRNAKATFTWSEDLENCDVVAYGFEDEEMDAMISAGAHEGSDLEGYNVELS